MVAQSTAGNTAPQATAYAAPKHSHAELPRADGTIAIAKGAAQGETQEPLYSAHSHCPHHHDQADERESSFEDKVHVTRHTDTLIHTVSEDHREEEFDIQKNIGIDVDLVCEESEVDGSKLEAALGDEYQKASSLMHAVVANTAEADLEFMHMPSNVPEAIYEYDLKITEAAAEVTTTSPASHVTAEVAAAESTEFSVGVFSGTANAHLHEENHLRISPVHEVSNTTASHSAIEDVQQRIIEAEEPAPVRSASFGTSSRKNSTTPEPVKVLRSEEAPAQEESAASPVVSNTSSIVVLESPKAPEASTGGSSRCAVS